MAGGIGSRFWPMSTPDYPKQFIDVMGVGRSLIQLTVDRLKPICPVENMWVVTNEKYIVSVQKRIWWFDEDDVTLSPVILHVSNDTKRKLETAETLLADANEKNRQLEAERKKNAKERKDLENEIALLRSDLYSGTKSQQ